LADPAHTGDTTAKPSKESRQNLVRHLSSPEDQVYDALKLLANDIAYEAKYRLYSHLMKYFQNQDVELSLVKLAASPGVIAENHGAPYTKTKAARQFIRTFLHMHDQQLHCVIIAYLKLFFDIISEPDAFKALVFALQREIKTEFHASEAWDIAMLHELFMFHNTTDTPKPQ
jgi:hypothetical protein